MDQSEVCQAGAALETLIHQFSDPLSFYRELVQNALDARSGRVDISIEHQPGTPDTMIIHVDDAGEGMTAEIIDTKLTRLFSSGKEDDLTKIGRFGIGFVSVFAVQPRAVVIDTSRGGETWRVVFAEDRSFTRIALTEPVQGTRIRVFKTATADECAEFIRRSGETLRFWCRHVEGEIVFQGERINEPFDVDSPCTVRRTRPGVDIIAGYPRDGRAFIGLYNGGLTLLESHEAFTFPGLAVKVNSRRLEHTMTRDGVVQDAALARVLAEVKDVVESELPSALLTALEQKVRERAVGADIDFLCAAAAACLGYPFRKVWASTELSHSDGEADGSDWMVLPRRHGTGHVVYGPYTRDLPAGDYTVRNRLRIESDGDNVGVTVDVRDAVSGNTLASQPLSRAQWSDRQRSHVGDGAAFVDVSLGFTAKTGQSLEFRTWWGGAESLWHRQVEVLGGRRIEPRKRPELHARVLFHTPGGREVSLGECLSRADRLYTARSASPLVEALEKQEVLVVLAEPEAPPWKLLEAILDGCPREAAQEWCLPIPVEPGCQEGARRLCDAVASVLKAHGARLSEVRLAHMGDASRVAASLARFGQPVRMSEIGTLPAGLFARPGVLALNADHPVVDALISGREPDLAAYFLVKLFLLPGGLSADDDAELALSSWEARCRKTP